MLDARRLRRRPRLQDAVQPTIRFPQKQTQILKDVKLVSEAGCFEGKLDKESEKLNRKTGHVSVLCQSAD